MSRPRFLADHDVNEQILNAVLRLEPGIEIDRAREVGMDGRPDPEVLRFAASQGRIVISHDVNTMSAHAYALIASGQPMSGLFLVSQGQPIRTIVEDIILIWSASDAEDWYDQVIFLPL